RHFSVNRMLAMDSVKLRLEREHELSFLEFNYMCLQAYDFTELNRRHGVTLQMGGSDQWGNIVKMRLEREHELSFLEFNYMCLQAYDFTELNRRHGVTLQMGGSDQWGNIV